VGVATFTYLLWMAEITSEQFQAHLKKLILGALEAGIDLWKYFG